MRHSEGGRLCRVFAEATFQKSRANMMIRPELISILVCPEDHSAVRLASVDLIAKINRAIALGTLTNRAGSKVERRFDGGLVRADRTLLYPIIDDIPMMLVDEAIPLNQPALES
jgi:uncharacterized protein